MVILQLSGCSGPLGLSAVTGTVAATITVDSHGLHVDVDGTNVAVEGAKLQLKSSGTASVSANLRRRRCRLTLLEAVLARSATM